MYFIAVDRLQMVGFMIWLRLLLRAEHLSLADVKFVARKRLLTTTTTTNHWMFDGCVNRIIMIGIPSSRPNL